jgi:hypothetical protein
MIGVNDEVLGAVVGSLLSGTIALAAALFGARWAANFTERNQRAARQYDSLVALYADVFADIHLSRRFLTSTVEPHIRVQGDSPNHASIGGRLMLLSTPEVQIAWEAYIAEMDMFRDYVFNATYVPHGDLLKSDSAPVIACEAKIRDLEKAAKIHLLEGGAPRC